MYYMGIDGGGTKTRYIIVDEVLTILADYCGPTIHIHQIGAKLLEERLSTTIDAVCDRVGISKTDLTFVFFGVPGYGESQDDQNIIDGIIKKVMSTTHYAVDNDGVVGWAGGTGCLPGINLVAGTGSIAIGRNKDGIIGRCGGWGPIIGDDASAHDIGIKVINEYTLQKDGRHEPTCLVNVVEDHFNITYQYEMCDIIFNRIQLNRTELASFALLGAQAASLGCVRCVQIFKNAAYELSLHVEALSKQLGLNENFIVSYTGGVFNAQQLVLNPLKEFLQPFNCHVQAPQLEPCLGAVLLAYHLAGHEITPKEINALKNQSPLT